MNIKKLLRPNKVVIIGASEKEGFGGDTCRNIIAYMKKGRYYFVNPRREQVFGLKCYNSIKDLPEQVDLMVICTPAGTVEGLIQEGAACGVRAAVVYASGYGEVGTEEGREKEAHLMKLCKELDMTLMGPNCAGFANFVDMTYPFAFISKERDRRGNVGVLSQSGQLVLTMMDTPEMKFSYAISAGNGKITRMEDYLDFLIDDEDTKVVAMYLEGVKNPDLFVNALKKAALKHKPVVVLKTGRSEKAQAIASSHTGSLSGADKVYDALFEKFGVIRVDDLEELMATANALATLKKLPAGKGLSAISLSGGETSICADLAELIGVKYVDFSPETLDRLNEILPSYATPNNPLDSTATLSYDTNKFASILEIIMKDEHVDMIAVGYTLLEEIADNAIYYMSEAMQLVSKEPWAKPMVVLPFSEMTRNPEYRDKLEKMGIPVLPTSLYAFKVIRNILEFVSNYQKDKNLEVSVPTSEKTTYKKVVLTESESKEIIRHYGINCGRYKVIHSQEEAAAAFIELNCEKVVAKVDSPDILHKSDVGCVILDIKNADDVMEAYQTIVTNAKRNCPDAFVKGVQICEMADPGVEMIIGVHNDPQFGPCVLCGLGGIFVEIFKDISLRLAPLSKEEAEEMVLSLKGVKMLQGYRGNSKCDINALAEAIVSVSNMACEYSDELLELDINPVFVRQAGICAVDALFIKKKLN